MKDKTYQKRDYIAAAIFSLTTAVRLSTGLIVIKIIANVGGPEGLGIVGQFMSVLAIVGVFSGGGISTGLTKYIAEKQSHTADTSQYLQTALAITICSGLLFGFLILLGAKWASQLLFSTEKYTSVIIFIAACQMFIGISNFSLAVMNGRRDVVGFSLATILGSLFGVVLMYLVTRGGGVGSLMFGLLCFSTSTAIFSPVILWFRHKQFRVALTPKFNTKVTSKLINFSWMQLVSAFTLPMAYILIRSIIEDRYGWSIVGYWQGVNKVSDAYLQFFLVFLANYFLPRLAEVDATEDLLRLVYGLFKIIIPICIASTVVIYIFRDLVIQILFSSAFSPMSDYFIFQLVGDVFKIAAYILAYVAISRAMFKVWVMAEILQASMLVLFTWIGSIYFGPMGLVGGYAVTYMIYFVLALLTFLHYSSLKKFDRR